MSMIDAALLFSDGQAVTATANSTNVIDLSVARDMAPGEDLMLVARVTQAFTASGAGTLTIALVAADDTGLSTNATTLWTSGAIGKATLVAGYRWRIEVPRPAGSTVFASPPGQRYLGLIFTVATGPMTAGKITAYLDLEAGSDALYFYPKAVGPVA